MIRHYAQIAEGYSDGIEERITEILFGPFNQMDANPLLQKELNKPTGFATWDQAQLHFIRHSPRVGPGGIYYDDDISLVDIASNLLAAADGKLDKSGRLRTRGRRFKLKRTYHERLLTELVYDSKARVNMKKRDKTKPANTDRSKAAVGITIDSILDAITRDEVIGQDGLLSDEESRRFLREMGDFITRFAPENPEPQTVEEPGVVPHEWVIEQDPVLEFERNFTYVHENTAEADVRGLGTLYAIDRGGSIVPILTRDILTACIPDTENQEAMHQVIDALFLPFEQTRDGLSTYQTRDDYPESFWQWLPGAQALGFALFPYRDTDGDVQTGYGLIYSELRSALINEGNEQFQGLPGFDNNSLEHLAILFTTFVRTLKENMARKGNENSS